MKNNRGKKGLIILIIVVLILLLILGVTFIFLGTDLLKSNKDLFFKYASKVTDKDIGIIDQNIINYYEKKASTPYSNSGKFDVEISSSNNAIKSQMKNTNNMDITFDGKIDLKALNFEENVSINYSDDVKFPIIFKKLDDLIGFQTKYVGSKFITTPIDNSYEALRNSNIDTPILENGKDITNIKINDEEKKYFYNKYISVIKDNLPDSSFSKISENGKTGYRLTLSGENINNIIVKLLETLRDDDMALEKINDYLESSNSSSKLTKDNISDLIEEIDPGKSNVENIIFTIYKDGKRISNLTVEISNVKFSVESTKSNNESVLSIAFEEGSNKILLNLKYKALESDNPSEEHELQLSTQVNDIISTSNSSNNESINKEQETIKNIINKVVSNKNTEEGVTEKVTNADIKKVIEEEGYQDVDLVEEDGQIIKLEFKNTHDYFEIDSSGEIISIADGQNNNQNNQEESSTGDSLSYTYKLSNSVKFDNSINFEKFTNENNLNLMDLDEDKRTALINKIQERLESVSKQQMEDLGISNNQNPISNMFPSLFIYNIFQRTNMNDLEYNNSSSNSFMNAGEGLNNTLITTFNNRFEKYEGNNLTGATVKGLLTEISTYNGLSYDEDEEESRNDETFKIEEINFNGQEYKDITEQTIKGLRDEIAVEDGYRVSFERKEDTGVIYRVVINKK